MHAPRHMRAKTAGVAIAVVCAAAVAMGGGCGSSSNSSGFTVDSGMGADTGLFADGPGGGSDGPSFTGEAGACTPTSGCDGGVCVSGQCCSVEHACGGSCCTGQSVCFLGDCVVPGATCQTSDQCQKGQYCEPALGGGDAGAPNKDSGCTGITTVGRCLPLPPTCPGDAGAEPDGGTCIESCQYHPPSGGTLNAVEKWSWGSPMATEYPDDSDVWSTPTVARMYDTNCDGKIDSYDSPVVVFVSGNVDLTCCSCNGAATSTCHTGVLRMLDGSSGKELWSLPKASPSSVGFMGLSIALGDVDGDGVADVVAMTGEGYIVVVDHTGAVKWTSDKPYGTIAANTGWGGGIAIADMDHDGHPEIAYGDTVWTTKTGAVTWVFTGGKGTGGGTGEELSAISDVDLSGDLELVAGNTAYEPDGTILWQNTAVPDGFDAIADFNKDGKPDVAVVADGQVWILNGADGTLQLGPGTLAGTGNGGPPTVADFDGDGSAEIGVAMATYYSVMKPNYATKTIDLLWKAQNHDFSSSVTGSTVFDFDGDGIAEVVYADECWLWVFEGTTGKVLLAWPHTSFTATEASMLADIDGDGHAEMLIPSNGIDPTSTGWDCVPYEKGGTGGTINGQYWTPGPDANGSYRGLLALGDSADSWVGTRTIWNEHTYHVTNICDDTDNACSAPNTYGSIPKEEKTNWTVPWLNDFRQNVEDTGLFNAPDAVVALAVDCSTPPVAQVSVRNIGQSGLPAGVEADVYIASGTTKVGSVKTTAVLLPGQTQTLPVSLSSPASSSDSYVAEIYVNPKDPLFHECNSKNDASAKVTPSCSQ